MEGDRPEMEIDMNSVANKKTLVADLLAAVLLAPATLTAQALPFHTETAITTGFEESAARTFSTFFGREGLRCATSMCSSSR